MTYEEGIKFAQFVAYNYFHMEADGKWYTKDNGCIAESTDEMYILFKEGGLKHDTILRVDYLISILEEVGKAYRYLPDIKLWAEIDETPERVFKRGTSFKNTKEMLKSLPKIESITRGKI
jgi:hypothetical protein